ncbi:MAG: BsuPI-related putative proteinase inhibitor [Candidatus Krumholzibacteria bacterium]
MGTARATGLMALLLLLGTATTFSCATVMETPPPQVEIAVATDKGVYAPNEPIRLEMVVRNRTDEVVVFEFSSGQRFDFVIVDEAGTVVWRWSADKAFITVLGEEQLAPGESLSYEERFEGALSPGTYTVLGMLVSSNEPLEASTTFDVSEEWFIHLPPRRRMPEG